MVPVKMLSGRVASSLDSFLHFLGGGSIPDGQADHLGSFRSVFGTFQAPLFANDERYTWCDPARFRRFAYIARTAGKTTYWLGEALRDLEEVAAGIEVDGPIPNRAVIVAARDFLVSLSPRIAADPGVDHDGSGGVGVEFVGQDGDRVLFIIKKDVTVFYHEYIEGKGKSRRYDTWSRMIQDINDSWLRRAKIPMRDCPSLMHDTWRWSSLSKASRGSETDRSFR